MKKLLVIIFALLTFIGVNAQIATENSKLSDNIYLGVNGGVMSPLDFNSMFPLNPAAGIKVGKHFNPTFGIEMNGMAVFNDNHFSDLKTFIKGTNVGVSGTINLTNLVKGYQGNPRVFEVVTNTGLGWLHEWNTSSNYLTANTGLDFWINVGKTRSHSFVISPTVLWNLNSVKDIKFNKKHSQLGIFVSYVYHFKTSNGTHHFKTYDVGAMVSEINRLNEELEACKNRPSRAERHRTRTSQMVAPREVYVNPFIVPFAKGSYELTDGAIEILNDIPSEVSVEIVATASPEGNAEYNRNLSDNRAKAVSDYLKSKGVTVLSAGGLGSTGETSQRIAIITVVN